MATGCQVLRGFCSGQLRLAQFMGVNISPAGADQVQFPFAIFIPGAVTLMLLAFLLFFITLWEKYKAMLLYGMLLWKTREKRKKETK